MSARAAFGALLISGAALATYATASLQAMHASLGCALTDLTVDDDLM